MSEHDMMLGGIAATKFATKNAYDGASTVVYKTSDQVREFYINSYKNHGGEGGNSEMTGNPSSAKAESPLPVFWGTRQKELDLQEKQMGVFSRNGPPENPSQSTSGVTSTPNKLTNGDSLSPEVALVHIATNTLETMAKALEHNSNVKIPTAERAAFANALKLAMDALAKQST